MHGIKAPRWTTITMIWFVILGLSLSGTAAAQTEQWVIAWGSALQGVSSETLTNATVQMIGRPTIAGDMVRVKLENTFSSTPLTIGAAAIGVRNYRAGLVGGSNRPLTFNGHTSVTIPAKGWIRSDAVPFAVEAQQDLAISLYVPGTNVPVSRHVSAYTTSYVTPNGTGNHAISENRSAFTGKTTNMYWLSAIEVWAAPATGALIVLGDSITNGTCSTTDAHDRWEDTLARRLLVDGRSLAVVNAGISGNRLSQGAQRLDRDVLQQAGLTHVVLFQGTNDIDRGDSAAQVIARMQDIITRVTAAGRQIIGVTILPRMTWNSTKTTIRHEVNTWMRTQAGFDAVVDFDAVVQEAGQPDVLNPLFNCDGVHPNIFGAFVMGQAVNLDSLVGLP